MDQKLVERSSLSGVPTLLLECVLWLWLQINLASLLTFTYVSSSNTFLSQRQEPRPGQSTSSGKSARRKRIEGPSRHWPGSFSPNTHLTCAPLMLMVGSWKKISKVFTKPSDSIILVKKVPQLLPPWKHKEPTWVLLLLISGPCIHILIV